MQRGIKSIQIGFTYIGTIVGAGFASGQEILQFFSRFGWMAVWTIAIASFIFIWLGTKLMLLARELGAKSYEDLNKYMFGSQVGGWVSLFTLVVLFGITIVMLAGAGTIFRDNLHLPFQIGALATLICTYWIVMNGVEGILKVNTVVVPFMLAFTVLIVVSTFQSPSAMNFLKLPNLHSASLAWLSPIMYVAFNLSLAQAVLVPVGANSPDKKSIYCGGIVGGTGIGVMLIAAHFALSAQMPGIAAYEIPMGHIVERLGKTVQTLYALVIFAEIFTTFLANVYGLTLQLAQRIPLTERKILIVLLGLSFALCQFGFKNLLTFLYPLFGAISLIWFGLVMIRHRDGASSKLY